MPPPNKPPPQTLDRAQNETEHRGRRNALLLGETRMFLRMLLTQISLQFFASFPPDFDLASAPHPPCRILSPDHVFAQNGCGACAAFAVATAAAVRACVREKRDWIPSPHRLFACGGGKCKGGSVIGRLVYALNKDGLITELTDNETDADFQQPCPQGGTAEEAKMSHYSVGRPHWYDVYLLDHKSELQIKQELYIYHNPVLMVAEPDDQMFGYRKSTYTPLPVFHPSAPVVQPSHLMVILGWGSTPEPHWIVQNSWGERWGDHGRGKLAPDSVVSAMVLDARGWRSSWVILFNAAGMAVVLVALEGWDWWRNRMGKEKADKEKTENDMV